MPTELIFEDAGEQKYHKLKKTSDDMDYTLKFLKKKTQWTNLAELYVDLIKEDIKKNIKESDSFLCLYDYHS